MVKTTYISDKETKSVRCHWSVEIMHWHLYVAFREDKNKTLEKTAAENLNIIRKWSLLILKYLKWRKNID